MKLPATEEPQAKEFGEIEKEKENMFMIIIEQNNDIRDMEVKLEKLLKEKEQTSQLAIVPLTTVPIAVATTLGASTSTSEPTQTKNELVKAMYNLNLHEHIS